MCQCSLILNRWGLLITRSTINWNGIAREKSWIESRDRIIPTCIRIQRRKSHQNQRLLSLLSQNIWLRVCRYQVLRHSQFEEMGRVSRCIFLSSLFPRLSKTEVLSIFLRVILSWFTQTLLFFNCLKYYSIDYSRIEFASDIIKDGPESKYHSKVYEHYV
jgi:hypothetical protein